MTESFEAQARNLADEARELIEFRLAEFTSRPEFLSRHLSAGFLARCIALLRGIRTLSDTGHDDICGVLFRVLVEACLLGLYVLLGGPAALQKVMGDHTRNVKRLAERIDSETINDLIADWDLANDRINLEQVAKDLGPLLEGAGDQNANALGIYDAAYRSESTFQVHGAGSAMRYLVVNDARLWRVAIRPDPLGVNPSQYLLLGSLYTVYFAAVAFKQWGYDAKDAADLLSRIAIAADLQAPKPPGSRPA